MSKDLDFDELDRAVNSLVSESKEKDKDEVEKNLDINTTLSGDESPIYEKLSRAAEGIGGETLDRGEQTLSLDDDLDDTDDNSDDSSDQKKPAKRAGRFMDMIHPSSDMKTSEKSSKKVSHEGVTIDVPTIDDSDDLEGNEIVTTNGDLPTHSDDADEVELDDDNDDTDTVDITVDDEYKDDKDDSDVTEDDVDNVNDVIDITEPEADLPSSPFLPDAKVEKRPLGSKSKKGRKNDSSTDDKKEDKTDDDIELSVNEPAKTDKTKGKSSKSSKEDDFSKIAAMESAEDNKSDEAEYIPEEYKDDILAVEKSENVVYEDSPTDADSDDKSADTTSSMAIPTQYKEKPSSVESENGAIYDTDNYHEPLKHPDKQKSGWTLVAVIGILIILGISLGAGAFFFGYI